MLDARYCHILLKMEKYLMTVIVKQNFGKEILKTKIAAATDVVASSRAVSGISIHGFLL